MQYYEFIRNFVSYNDIPLQLTTWNNLMAFIYVLTII